MVPDLIIPSCIPVSPRQNPPGCHVSVTLWDWVGILTLGESVGLHHVQKSVHHVEQNPYRSRFVMGQCFVNSRRHITEIQLSRGWESPRLRLLLEFAGRWKHPEQQQHQEDDPGLQHRVETRPRPVVKLGLNRDECKLEDACLGSYLPYQKGRGEGARVNVKSVQMDGPQLFKSCCPRRESLGASFPTVWGYPDGRKTGWSSPPVSGLQSHRDERACRYHFSICASRERAGVRAAASTQGGLAQREALLLPGEEDGERGTA